MLLNYPDLRICQKPFGNYSVISWYSGCSEKLSRYEGFCDNFERNYSIGVISFKASFVKYVLIIILWIGALQAWGQQNNSPAFGNTDKGKEENKSKASDNNENRRANAGTYSDMENADKLLEEIIIQQSNGASKAVTDSIVHDMSRDVPNTPQYYFARYLAAGRTREAGPDLAKAYSLDPMRVELYKELARYFIITNDRSNLSTLLKNWVKLDEIPDPLYEYGKNLLNTLPQNAILITDGTYDTYPLYILQEVNGVRKDVRVLNLDLLQDKEYRERIYKETGITCTADPSFKANYVKQLVSGNSHIVFYISSTVNSFVIIPIENNLYSEGLAMRYSTVAYDPSSRLRNNWEKNYNIAYLEKAQKGTEYVSVSRLNALNMNYVACGLEMYDLYLSLGMEKEAALLADLLVKLAEKAGNDKVKLVNEYLGR